MGIENKRLFPRVPVHLAVTYRSASELRAATIETLSEGGVFIKTRAPLPIGTPITVEISLEDHGDKPVVIPGKVAWIKQQGDTGGGPEGMGIAFTEALPAALRKILTEAAS